MNYRHAFHAGNFADVLKHIVLTLILSYLREKSAAFRVIDTHAGAGLYDLTGAEAARSGEWRAGVNLFLNANFESAIDALLSPYRDAVASHNPGHLTRYPGSPLIALSLLRPQDRLIACELEPKAAAALARHLGRDARAKAVAIDGWTALEAYVPPKERRGLVLIDPPFEQPDEFSRLAGGLAAAHRKWSTGIFMAWYPIKQPGEPEAFGRKLARLGIPKILRAELTIGTQPDTAGLAGSGLVVINPPWTLERGLARVLPALGPVLSPRGRFGTRLDWLAGEK